jgi:hydroxymethylbilane synthase
LHKDLVVELVPLVTQGDRILDKPLAVIGGKGLFLKELERALIDGEADLAVHSMKDVPVDSTPGLTTGVVLKRANPSDAWVSREGISLEDLPAGCVVGSSSLRRRSQLLNVRPELKVVDLRGNVNTRLRKLDEQSYDAIILACAGLERLGMADRITHELAPPEWLPATAQGTIGLQYRDDDDRVQQLISGLGDRTTAKVTRAERAAAMALQGSCRLPLAVYARLQGQNIHIRGMVGDIDGTQVLRSERLGPASDP